MYMFVNENHRDSKKVKYTTDNYEKAVIFGIVSYKKLNDKNYRSRKGKRIA